MQPIQSNINTRDKVFQRNVQHNRELAKQLHERWAEAHQGGGEKYCKRPTVAVERRQMLAVREQAIDD